jgi:hypothetical protein
MTVVEQNSTINSTKLAEYIPMNAQLPAVVSRQGNSGILAQISVQKEKLCTKFFLI